MRTITIEIAGSNTFAIREGDRSCSQLTWDEMLGTVAELTHPRIGKATYRMLTPAEEAAWNAKWYGHSPQPQQNVPPLALPAPTTESTTESTTKAAP